MAIYSNNINNNQNRSGNLGSTSTRRVYRPAGSNITVREGETLKGVVSDIHGQNITIALDDGNSFTGKLQDASQYSIGQKAGFVITSTDNNTIYMKATSSAYILGMEDTMDQALEEAGLPKSPRNLEIVKSLLNNTQSISKENILRSMQLCSKYPGADVDSVITMKRLGMEMTDDNINQFTQYKNGNHQLLYKMDSLTDNINSMIKDLATENPTIARYAIKEVLTSALSVSPSPEEASLTEMKNMQAVAGENMAAINGEGVELVLNGAGGANAAGNAAVATDAAGNPIAPGDAANLAATDEAGNSITNGDAANPAATDAAGNPIAAGEKSLSPFSKMKQFVTDIASKINITGDTSANTESPFINEQTGSILTASEREELSGLLTKVLGENISEDALNALKDGSSTSRDVLTLLNKVLLGMDDADMAELFTSKGIGKLLKNQFMSDWTLSPNSLRDPENLKATYDNMNKQFMELSNLSRMFATRGTAEMTLNQANDMRSNMDFMNLLNQNYSYLQLPIKLSGENAHGDLYVMTRKNTLKKSKDNLKALLHLDMDALGPIDIHITKRETDIQTQFFVEKDSAKKLMEKNIEILKDSINEQGYSFSSEFVEKKNNFNLVNDFMSDMSTAPVGSTQRYNFDLRA